MTRTNPLGYKLVPEKIRQSLFGSNTAPDSTQPERLQYALDRLSTMGFELPPDDGDGFFPEGFELPPLKGNSLFEHVEKAAEEQLGDVLVWIEELLKAKVPDCPGLLDLRLEEGWFLYAHDGTISKVEQPEENAYIFDTETFVKGGSFPIIGTAVGLKGVYVWLAREFVDPTTPVEDWQQFDMIPVGRNKLICGHNVAYDRIRTQEAYTLDSHLENYWLDTLSMHIATCGLAANQRWLYILGNKEPELLTPEERKKLRYKPKWLKAGATNSLVATYNFHVYESRKWEGAEAKEMQQAEKKIRDVFVKAETMSDFYHIRPELIQYAIKDSIYTLELFQYLYPRYRDSTPSNTALMGHFYLGGSRVPLSNNWEEWLEGTENKYQELVSEVNTICRNILDKEVEEWKANLKKDLPKGCDSTRKLRTYLRLEPEFPNIKKWYKDNPWRKQFDWTPKLIGNSKKFPEWKGKILPLWCHKIIMDESIDVGVKSRTAHLLLRLTWQGSPLRHSKENGWIYYDQELGRMEKVPHPKRPGENVGGVLTKDFLKHADAGILDSKLPEAKRVLDISNAISYWTSVRKRVFDRIVKKVDTPEGTTCNLTVPSILPHGTLTRRVVEPLFATMCGTKSFRVGTELKTRIEAPKGYKIVGGDYDGQEMRMAQTYADVFESGLIGGSPLGYQILSGSKKMATDSHSYIARSSFPEYYEDIIFHPELGACEEVNLEELA